MADFGTSPAIPHSAREMAAKHGHSVLAAPPPEKPRPCVQISPTMWVQAAAANIAKTIRLRSPTHDPRTRKQVIKESLAPPKAWNPDRPFEVPAKQGALPHDHPEAKKKVQPIAGATGSSSSGHTRTTVPVPENTVGSTEPKQKKDKDKVKGKDKGKTKKEDRDDPRHHREKRSRSRSGRARRGSSSATAVPIRAQSHSRSPSVYPMGVDPRTLRKVKGPRAPSRSPPARMRRRRGSSEPSPDPHVPEGGHQTYWGEDDDTREWGSDTWRGSSWWGQSWCDWHDDGWTWHQRGMSSNEPWRGSEWQQHFHPQYQAPAVHQQMVVQEQLASLSSVLTQVMQAASVAMTASLAPANKIQLVGMGTNQLARNPVVGMASRHSCNSSVVGRIEDGWQGRTRERSRERRRSERGSRSSAPPTKGKKGKKGGGTSKSKIGGKGGKGGKPQWFWAAGKKEPPHAEGVHEGSESEGGRASETERVEK